MILREYYEDQELEVDGAVVEAAGRLLGKQLQ